jgi:hypothetical protein
MKQPEFKKEPGVPKFDHMVQLSTQHEDGGHKHHSNMYKAHGAGHMLEHEKVQKLCGGGMARKK